MCFDGLCPEVNALLSRNGWVLVTVRLSKQTQPQDSIEIVHASNMIDAHDRTRQQIIFVTFKYWCLALGQIEQCVCDRLN